MDDAEELEAPLEDVAAQVEGAQEAESLERLAVVELPDRSTYAGQVDADGAPDGSGVLTSVFGSVYAGEMARGSKHGVGVETGLNGSVYFGEFRDGRADGYGVYMSCIGHKYIGQWQAGTRSGVGMCVDPSARPTVALFAMDEVVDSDETQPEAFHDCMTHIQRAFFAETRAIQSQEQARSYQLRAELQQDLTVCATPEQLSAFNAKEDAELDAFVQRRTAETEALEAAAGALKLEEAQLTQRQKQLRTQIEQRGQELARVARFCELAAVRRAEVANARRSLALLQHQLDSLVGSVSANQSS